MMGSDLDFTGARVLVVGASRGGIGAAIARAFQHAGAAVAITGAETEPATQDHGRFTYTQLDVTDTGRPRRWTYW
jgi:NAD(P)-dependent dehydrogenase (short-subunit alcohol dehydrogenase family)